VAGLVHTFVDPWDAWWLAVPVLSFAAAGGVGLLRRHAGAFTMLVVAAVPYAVFHLVFQETFTTRYALPLVPVVAYLCVRGLALGGRSVLLAGAAGFSLAGLAFTAPALQAYSTHGSPVARAVRDLRADLPRQAEGRVLAMHHPFAIALRDEHWDMRRLPIVRRRLWLEIVKYWQGGETTPVWLLSQPGVNGLDRYHELALMDPTARTLRGSYKWAFDASALLGGARPSEVDWFELRAPGWFATTGWDLTPDLAGLSRLDGRGPASGGATALVRRRSDAAVVLAGGRNLGAGDAPEVRFDLVIDGRSIRAWRVRPQPGFFLDLWTLEPGALDGPGPFATLAITAEAADGSGRAVDAAIEQFDVQPAQGSVVFGFDQGWHEQEYSPQTNLLWRWTGARARLRVHGSGNDLRCTIRGESTVRYFDRPSKLSLSAGTQLIAELEPPGNFEWTVTVPGETLRAADGILTLTTDQTFVPHERNGNGDRRHLGVRVFEVSLEAARVRSR
jgi:hypothetical protein